MSRQLIFLLCDSICNSIFEGQILRPLLQKLENDPTLTIHLISFERPKPPNRLLTSLQKKHPRLKLRVFNRLPYMGFWSLYSSIARFKKLLQQFKSYQLIARGPLAGAIALKSISPFCSALTIQVRGLLTKEYLYSSPKYNPIRRLRAFIYRNLEKKVYQPATSFTMFEVVSSALKDYLRKSFGIPCQQLIVATEDIPAKLSWSQHRSYRIAIRKTLRLDKATKVLVYNGSAKPWQCPDQMLQFFVKQKRNNFLLIITQDQALFKKIISQYALPNDRYLIITLSQDKVIKYLCAADFGLLFREKHLLNWVSRPTKALEYQAARLKIIHNNTVHFMLKLS